MNTRAKIKDSKHNNEVITSQGKEGKEELQNPEHFKKATSTYQLLL